MSRFLADIYSATEEYIPGEQPQDRQYIKLNTNESPYPPSDSVRAAISDGQIDRLRLYCDPDALLLREAIAKEYGVSRENVFVANGSDDILNFSFMAFSQDGAIYPDITYGFYEIFAKLHRVDSKIIPLAEDFTIKPECYYNSGRMVVIANPNAPTGLLLSLDEIERLVSSNPDNVVVIDEAYIDFGGESAVGLTKKYPNLLVVMTYSKSRSLAGARLGFAIADRELIKDLYRLRNSTNPYNVNSLTQLAGIAAMEQSDYYRENCQRIIASREYTSKELRSLGFFVTDSKANFIFARSDKIAGGELYLELKRKGILVRHFNKERINDYIRISVGTQEDMTAFIRAVKEILDEKG